MEYANITIPQLVNTIQVLLEDSRSRFANATRDSSIYWLHKGYVDAYEVLLKNLVKEAEHA